VVDNETEAALLAQTGNKTNAKTLVEERPTPPTIAVVINGKKVRGIIDCGSQVTIISHDVLKALGLKIDGPSGKALVGVDGKITTPLGVAKDLPIHVGGLDLPWSTLVVASNAYQLVLGWDWQKHFRTQLDAHNMTFSIRKKRDCIVVAMTDGLPKTPDNDDEELVLEPREMEKVISLYAVPIEDMQPSDVSVWTESSPQIAETNELFANPWAKMVSPPKEVYEPQKETLVPAPVAQEPNKPSEKKVTFKPTPPPPTYCMEVSRYLQMPRLRQPIVVERPTYTFPHDCGSKYVGDSPHVAGSLACWDCKQVMDLQKLYLKNGVVHICGNCPVCEDIPYIPEGVMALAIPQRPPTPPVDDRPPVAPPVRAPAPTPRPTPSPQPAPAPSPVRESRAGQRKCRNTMKTTGCGQWKPMSEFLSGSKRCAACRQAEIDRRHNEKMDRPATCYICGKPSTVLHMTTNGLAPGRFFCSAECSKAINVQHYHRTHNVTWDEAVYRIFSRSRKHLHWNTFDMVCANLQSQVFRPGFNQEYVEWISAEQEETQLRNTSSADAFWSIVEAQQDPHSSDPVQRAMSWADQMEFFLIGSDPMAPQRPLSPPPFAHITEEEPLVIDVSSEGEDYPDF